MKNFFKNKKISLNKGALLLELLIVISLLAVILSFGINAMFLSLKSNKVSGERDIANALATESLEAVRATVEENWQNIYSLTKTTQNYYPKQSLGKWVLTTVPGDGTITIGGVVFTRYVVIDNVCRDNSTREVTGLTPCTIPSTQADDPSTQRVSSIVSWPGSDPITIYEYFFRWKNKVCTQGGWVAGVPGNSTQDCTGTGTNYDSKEDTVFIDSNGSFKLQ